MSVFENIFKLSNDKINAEKMNLLMQVTNNKMSLKEVERVYNILDEKVIDKLCANGVKLIALRCAGFNNVDVKAAQDAGEDLPYHFVEVMACPGGCIAGGGQPKVMMHNLPKPWGITDEIRKKRSLGLNCEDEKAKNRLSHHNEEVKRVYAEFLGQPGEGKAHELLHTKYRQRNLYK